MFSRILLLVLLPVVALCLYVKGQRYDPALIRFISEDIVSGSHSAFLPEKVGSFIRSGSVRNFSKDNLYEYVNGHAEYFLSAGFESLVVGDYLHEGNPVGQADLVVDIYDMGKPLYASSILVDEIGGTPDTLSFGAIGAHTGQGISFISGKYYARISVFRADVPIDAFTKSIYDLLGPTTKVVDLEVSLPDSPGAGTTRFVKEAYRGLDFANNIQERAYTVNNAKVQVALAAGSPVETEALFASYTAFFQESDVEVAPFTVNGWNLHKVKDPYEGDWYLVVRPGGLYGIYGVTDAVVLQEVLIVLFSDKGEEGP